MMMVLLELQTFRLNACICRIHPMRMEPLYTIYAILSRASSINKVTTLSDGDKMDENDPLWNQFRN